MFSRAPSTRSNLWTLSLSVAVLLSGLALAAMATVIAGVEPETLRDSLALDRIREPLVAAAWGLAGLLALSGLTGLLRSASLAAVATLALLALTTAAVLWRGNGAPPPRPAATVAFDLAAADLVRLRNRLYAFAQAEGFTYEDRGPAVAKRQGRADAVWIELRRDETLVVVASDLLHPGRAAIDLYSAPDERDGAVWRERLIASLSGTWPDLTQSRP